MNVLESEVKKKLKAFLDAHASYYFMPVQTGYGKATLDFIVCAGGLFVGMETKRPGVKTPTKRQATVIEQIKAAGGVCYVVTMDERDNLVWWKQ